MESAQASHISSLQVEVVLYAGIQGASHPQQQAQTRFTLVC